MNMVAQNSVPISDLDLLCLTTTICWLLGEASLEPELSLLAGQIGVLSPPK